ncbi:MAG TPA: hypothetical protein VGB47_02380 [Thermoanaerobaculia bacterium]
MEKARRSRGVRLATLLAACLASATAFGLHPEPGGDRSAAPGLPGIELPASRIVESGRHDCLACRAHRPLVSIPFLSVLPSPRRSAPRALVSRPSAIAAFEPTTPDGRAPPGLS